MFKKIKIGVGFLKQPNNVYEENHLLLMMLRHCFVLPLKICTSDEHKQTLIFSRNRIILPVFVIVTIIYLFVEEIRNSSYFDASYTVMLVYDFLDNFARFNSICVLYLISFSLVTKLEGFFNEVWLLDNTLITCENLTIYRKTKIRHAVVVVVLIVPIIRELRNFIPIYNFTSLSDFYISMILRIPFINMFLAIYCHLSLVVILYQRFNLIASNIEIVDRARKLDAERKAKLLINLKMFSNLCDVIEHVNYNFGALFASALTSAIIWMIKLTFMKIKNFENFNIFDFVIFNWKTITLFITLFTHFYMCHKSIQEVSACLCLNFEFA